MKVQHMNADEFKVLSATWDKSLLTWLSSLSPSARKVVSYNDIDSLSKIICDSCRGLYDSMADQVNDASEAKS
jgi:hypothetical protein